MADLDKTEIGDVLNKRLCLTGSTAVDWTKLSMRELMDVYGATGKSSGSGGKSTAGSFISGLPMGSGMKDKLAGLVDGMSESEMDTLMSMVDKRKKALGEGFPIMKRLMNQFQAGDQEDKK